SISSIENITVRPLSDVVGKELSASINIEKIEGSEPKFGRVPADHLALKKHIATSIKYSAAAKAANALGYVQVNFLVKDKKISNIEIAKGLHPDLDKDVLSAVASFTSQISIPDNDYVITVLYLDSQKSFKEQNIEKISKNILYAKNYLGGITAFVKENGDVNGGWSISVSRPNPVTGKQEPIGFDGSAVQDRMPSFPGGMKAWQEYLVNTLKFPPLAKSNNVQGNVIVKFTVEKDGSLGEIKVLRGIGSGADEEAVRVIAQSPKWIPGTIDGKPARVTFTVPINFGGSNPVQMGAGRDVPDGVFDFSTAEVLPEFEGGMAGWGKYLSENLKYPEQAKKDSISGRVIVGFVVEKDGSLSDIKVLRGIGGGADEEAVRVLKNSPNWKPGKILDGNVVRVAYTMPIFFKLGNK
ncbi:MAG: energy transducer TonB, partial [Daejeonella sp.]|uniref:energy transducer TonB n=1 Tax=Daejeonella sp. TaxID=2805397 RepID=UPI003C760CCC